jgi:chromosome segregation protein
MKIKRLEIHGFKSFADRTVLHFGEGITGVLGPNGCGKSNVVDALRWAMGEQSAKHLRGGSMEDVIFAGSESRGPMGLAEVTITFKNDGDLVPPEYRGLSEISVTRRLFRDGRSDYLLNKQPCLLRTIHELFMGTGIGRNSYAIIEQGRIGVVVTAKPEDRRALIEDAAGITKYKARRKQAERKLDAAEQNLLRVGDIVSELEKRMGTLERQAKKAEKYKLLKAQLRELDLCAAAHRHLELVAVERFEAGELAALREALDLEHQRFADQESAIDAARGLVEEKEKALRTVQARLAELERTLALGDRNLEHLQRELGGLDARRTEAQRERKSLEGQLAEAKAEHAELIATADALGESGGEDVDRLASEQRSLAEVEAEITRLEAQLEREKQALVDCLTRIAHHENNVTNLDRSAADLEARMKRIREEIETASTESKSLEKKARDSAQRLDDNRQLKLALEDRRVAQENLLERHQVEFVDNEGELLGLREELMDKRSRLSSLLEIQRNYEGCQAGVRALMRRRQDDPEIGSGLHGLVADVLASEPRYEAAVEAVLGERLQYMVVASQDDGLRSIDYLKQAADGRASFIPMNVREDHTSWAPRQSSRPPQRASDKPKTISDRPPPAEVQALADAAQAELLRRPQGDVATSLTSDLPVPDPVWDEEWDWWPDLDTPGVCGKMVDLVSTKPGYEQIARVLLGDVLVVDGFETARELWEKNGHRKTLVTLGGEVLDPVGVLAGGSSEGVSAGMLAKKREIAELTETVQALELEVRQAEEKHRTLKQLILEAEQAIQGLSRDGHAEDLSIVKLEQDVRGLRENAARQAERRVHLQRDLDAMVEERGAIEAERKRSHEVVAELGARRDQAKQAVEAASAQLQGLRQRGQQLGAAVTELKVNVAATAEKREGSRRALARTEARITDLERRIEKLGSNIEQGGDEAGRLGKAIEDGQAQRVQTQAELVDVGTALETVSAEHAEAAEALRARELEVREHRDRVDGLKQGLSDGQVRLREQQISLRALHDQVQDRYQLDLVSVLGEHHLSPLQGDDAGELRADLRRRIERMGEINLTAIREFEEVSERHGFLAGQKHDLETAIRALKAAIRKIDGTSKERFVEAFELVRTKFETVFPRLFNGGKATLVLNDPSNPLESGVELLAQPPGKNMQSVSLLSGGEKALTAISLIFSIFLIKPTPFCLLDEVDAPLDDANVGRYNEMVRDMSSISQFILITHNKRTMEIPDRLYGVTMEEPGISKLVGVDVRETSSRLSSARLESAT